MQPAGWCRAAAAPQNTSAGRRRTHAQPNQFDGAANGGPPGDHLIFVFLQPPSSLAGISNCVECLGNTRRCVW